MQTQTNSVNLNTNQFNQTVSVESNSININAQAVAQTQAIISLCDKYANAGKNATIVKAFLLNKKSTKLTLLNQLGYDFQSISISAALTSSQLKNHKSKLEKILMQDSLHDIYTVLTKLIKNPNQKTATAVMEFFNSAHSVKYRLIEKINPTVIEQINNLAEGQAITEWAECAPLFLTVNLDINGNVIAKAKANADADVDTVSDADVDTVNDADANSDADPITTFALYALMQADPESVLMALAAKMGIELGVTADA